MVYKRNYRRRRSGNNLGSTVGDMGAIANKFGPRGALIVGVVGFIVLYFLVPLALEAWLEYNKAKMSGPAGSAMGQVLDKIFSSRFIRVSEWAGIAALLLCSGIAAWKALTQESVSYQGQRNAGLFAKLIARFLD